MSKLYRKIPEVFEVWDSFQSLALEEFKEWMLLREPKAILYRTDEGIYYLSIRNVEYGPLTDGRLIVFNLTTGSFSTMRRDAFNRLYEVIEDE